MQITALQIKLGRIALDWTQSEFAKRVGVGKGSIVNLESGKDTTQKIYNKSIRVLRDEGIEFLEGNGIRQRQDRITHYEGVKGFGEFMEDVYATAIEYGGDICLFNSKPSLWHKYLGKEWYDMHNERMAKLGDKIRVRIVVAEGDSEFILNTAEHRWISRDKWRGRIFYAYGNKLGFLNFQDDRIHITVIKDADFSESFKIMFDVVWDNETQIPKDTA